MLKLKIKAATYTALCISGFVALIALIANYVIVGIALAAIVTVLCSFIAVYAVYRIFLTAIETLSDRDKDRR